VRRGQQLDVGRDLTIGADRDRRPVEHHAAVVDERAGADRDVPAVIAVQRRLHDDPLADPAQQLAQEPVALLAIRVAGRVVALAQLLPAGVPPLHLGVAEDVQLSPQHPRSHLGHPVIVR
jgi:hypothetical protein